MSSTKSTMLHHHVATVAQFLPLTSEFHTNQTGVSHFLFGISIVCPDTQVIIYKRPESLPVFPTQTSAGMLSRFFGFWQPP